MVEIVEVGPRDGLQNEAVVIPTEAKVELIRRSIDAGVRRIEVTSFVHPERVPQMADAESVCAQLPRRDDVSYIGLVLNRRGFERAIDADVDEINAVVVATDTFNQRNQGATVDETLALWEDLADRAREHGVRAGLTIGAAFGCPFEGEVPVDVVTNIARRAVAAGPDELALADTIGVAVPSDVRERVEAVAEVAGEVPLRCHFHDTRNTGIANAYAALLSGVSALDASIGGIGGCPFAPDATGNIPTEDLAYMLTRMGRADGISLPHLMETAQWIGEQLGTEVPGMLSRAGTFPPDRDG